MNDFRHKDYERHVGERPWTCARPDIKRTDPTVGEARLIVTVFGLSLVGAIVLIGWVLWGAL